MHTFFAWEAQDLFKWAILFFLFVLPALKGVFEKKKEAAAPPGRRPEREPTPEEDPWERLLRGESVDSPSPPPLEPAPRPEPRIAPVPAPARRPVQKAGTLTKLEGFHPEELTPAKMEELHTDLPALHAFSDGEPLVGAAERAAVVDSADRAARLPADEWRRAVVLAEVLAPPVALRAGSLGTIPPV